MSSALPLHLIVAALIKSNMLYNKSLFKGIFILASKHFKLLFFPVISRVNDFFLGVKID